MELTKLEKALIDKISAVSNSEELWYNNYQETNTKHLKINTMRYWQRQYRRRSFDGHNHKSYTDTCHRRKS